MERCFVKIFRQTYYGIELYISRYKQKSSYFVKIYLSSFQNRHTALYYTKSALFATLGNNFMHFLIAKFYAKIYLFEFALFLALHSSKLSNKCHEYKNPADRKCTE